MIPFGSLVTLVTPKGRRHIKKLEPDGIWHFSEGALDYNYLATLNFGDVAFTNLGKPLRLEEATLYDRLMGLKRQTQIIYPKDIALICLRLGVGEGRVILEAGCGSGALTIALSWFAGKTGKIISHDAREEFTHLARRNLDWAQVGANVELHCRDVRDGFAVKNADAVFLDMREPWLALESALAAVKPGATFAFLLPTTGQMQNLLLTLEKGPFDQIEICELFLRGWKPLADRLRPNDRMTAHTGFLIFCRQAQKSAAWEEAQPAGTRERKQIAAKKERLEENEI